MSAFTTTSTQAIKLDLSGLTSVLAIVLAIGVVVLMVWMWRIGHELETAIEPSAEPPTEPVGAAVSTLGDGASR